MAKKESTGLDPMIAGILNGVKGLEGCTAFGNFIEKRPVISSGSLGLDLKFGGGIPTDRIIEYYGPSASFKTSFALLAMKSYVDTFGYDRPPYIVDMERTITADFVRGFGLDPDKIIVSRPKTAEQCLDIISNIMNSGKFGFGILDSVDALESEEETKKSYSENTMMKVAKLMSAAMRDLSKASVDNNTGLILINQTRVGSNGYQMIEKTSGGDGIFYYSSLVCRFAKKGPSEDVLGAITVKANPKKNKLAPLIQAECTIDLIPGVGVDRVSDYLDVSKQIGVITQAGAYYSLLNSDGELVGKFQGRTKFGEWLNDSDDNIKLFETLVRNKWGSVSGSMVSEKNEASVEEL